MGPASCSLWYQYKGRDGEVKSAVGWGGHKAADVGVGLAGRRSIRTTKHQERMKSYAMHADAHHKTDELMWRRTGRLLPVKSVRHTVRNYSAHGSSSSCNHCIVRATAQP